MVEKQDFRQITPFVWELPRGYDPRMRAPARIFGNSDVFERAFRDSSVQQLCNVAMLPGIVKAAMAMPDVHEGYGFPIGGVAAFPYDSGLISPGGVGYDINCGVRMLASTIPQVEIMPHLEALTMAIYQNCPSGVGEEGALRLTSKALDQVLENGAEWTKSNGYASREDLEATEDGGVIQGARAEAVPSRARERGIPQLGSLGAGNHFLEIDVVDEIFDADIARDFGLRDGCVVVQIHCGSRGLGHEVCGQYLRRLQDAPQRYNIPIADRELAAAPLTSPEGRDYLAAMFAAANYAFANRQMLAHFVRLSFEQALAGKVRNWHLRQVYDVAHNIAKVETHIIEGKPQKLVVHRKGATRAFPPGHPDLAERFRLTGQPVLVPGSMGTSSFVLVGTPEAMTETFGSTCHGAGRTMSRKAATRSTRGEDVQADLRRQGILVQTGSLRGLAEEAPHAYKDVSLVVDSVVGADLARKVARVRPIAVIKG